MVSISVRGSSCKTVRVINSVVTDFFFREYLLQSVAYVLQLIYFVYEYEILIDKLLLKWFSVCVLSIDRMLMCVPY